jgi:hypothetical protein
VADGYTVKHTPAIGAIMQMANSAGGLGHVAYVTAIDPVTGQWKISEMNVKGLDVVDTGGCQLQSLWNITLYMITRYRLPLFESSFHNQWNDILCIICCDSLELKLDSERLVIAR